MQLSLTNQKYLSLNPIWHFNITAQLSLANPKYFPFKFTFPGSQYGCGIYQYPRSWTNGLSQNQKPCATQQCTKCVWLMQLLLGSYSNHERVKETNSLQGYELLMQTFADPEGCESLCTLVHHITSQLRMLTYTTLIYGQTAWSKILRLLFIYKILYDTSIQNV